jgi:hypothetical protein
MALAPAPGWQACFTGLALVYGIAFFGVVAGYFWARWYAMGVGISGLVGALISMWQIGMEPVLLFYGATHAAVPLFLWGGGMANVFDGRAEWRTRFHLDEHATNRLGKAVIRLGISLPYVIMYALAPREGAGGALLALTGAVLIGLGAWALSAMRTWSILALIGGAGALAASLPFTPPTIAIGTSHTLATGVLGAAAVALVLTSITPFVGPIARFVRARA